MTPPPAEKIRFIAIDDNPLDLLAISEYAARFDLLENCGLFSNALEGYGAIRATRPHVVFLDIEMPVFSGIELLRKIREEVPVAVFVTSHPEYALEGFELSALDYILKPVEEDRFGQALHRIADYLEMKRKSEAYEVWLESDTLVIREGYNQVKLSQREIVYLEAMQDYTRVVTTDRPYMTLSSLTFFLAQLPAERFLRIHRSYAVARWHIKEVRGSEIVCSSGTLPVGKTYRSSVSKIKL